MTRATDLASRVLRSRIRALQRFRSGLSDGTSTAAALSRTLDRFFAALVAPWSSPVCGYAILALGSYGRRGLCLHSDVDCLLLHLGSEPRETVEALAAGVRALWDIGVQARVASYSLARARRLVAADERVLASLLDHRFVAGSPDGVTHLRKMLADLPERHIRRLARLLLREDEARIGKRHQDLFAAEPDLKSGQGGLRDLAALGWFERWAGFGRRHLFERASVREMLREKARRHAVLRQARETLLTARLLLDVAGMPRDRFTREAASLLERQQVPRYLPGGFERDLAMARIQVSGLLKALAEAILRGVSPANAEEDLAALVTCSRKARPVLPASFVGGLPQRLAPETARAFLKVLEAPDPRPVLETLLRAGTLHRVVPGFHRTMGHVPGDEVHAYTLDRHLVLAASHVADILNGTVAPPAGMITPPNRFRVPLLLAALLHDLGKTAAGGGFGSPRPVHPEVGARLARLAALKLGLPHGQADLVAFLCRHHMVLPEASTTLDCESPDVLERLANIFPDPERLDLVMLLGLADMRSLGPDTATTFREALLVRTWSALRRHLLAAGEGVDAWRAEAEARRTLLARSLTVSPGNDWLASLVRSLPERLLMAIEPERLAIYLQEFEAVLVSGPRVIVEPASAPGPPSKVLEVTYLGQDELGLLSRLCGAMTLQGLSIQEARIFSLGPVPQATPPLVLDQFVVSDPSGIIVSGPDATRLLAQRILTAASDPSVARRVQARLGSVLRLRPGTMQAEVDNTSLPDRTVFRVAGPDAPGLLHVLADILYRHGINVSGAIVTTEAGMARDTFFAEWAITGGKVLDPDVIRRVLRAISSLGRQN